MSDFLLPWCDVFSCSSSGKNHPAKNALLPEKYAEYASFVDGMQIKKDSKKSCASTNVPSPSALNKRSRDIFGKPVAERLKTIADFLDGKYDGVIEGVVKIRVSELHEHLEGKKTTQNNPNH